MYFLRIPFLRPIRLIFIQMQRLKVFFLGSLACISFFFVFHLYVPLHRISSAKVATLSNSQGDFIGLGSLNTAPTSYTAFSSRKFIFEDVERHIAKMASRTITVVFFIVASCVAFGSCGKKKSAVRSLNSLSSKSV